MSYEKYRGSLGYKLGTMGYKPTLQLGHLTWEEYRPMFFFWIPYVR